MLSRSIRPGRPGAALAVLGVRGRLYGVCFWPFRPGDVWSAAGGGVGTVYAHLRRDQRDGGGVSGGRGLWDRGWGGGVCRCQRGRQCRDLRPSPVGNDKSRFFVSEVAPALLEGRSKSKRRCA